MRHTIQTYVEAPIFGTTFRFPVLVEYDMEPIKRTPEGDDGGPLILEVQAAFGDADDWQPIDWTDEMERQLYDTIFREEDAA